MRTIPLALATLLVLVAISPRRAAGDAAQDVAARAKRALEQDVQELVRVAEWGDRNGAERLADRDWERVMAQKPDDERARKRLKYVQREGRWMRDEASWAILQSTTEAKVDRARAYEAKRRQEFERPSSFRHRDVALAARVAGLASAADAELRIAIGNDPGDYWSRLSLGYVPDPDDGWVMPAVRTHRIVGARAAADVRRLKALQSEPVGEEAPSKRSAAAGKDLSAWRLREWRLETDLPAADAAMAIGAVDLAARWFREFFGMEPGARVLPGEGVFVVLTTEAAYRSVIAGTSSLSKFEKEFASGLGAYPLAHKVDEGPWEVVIQRPEGSSAADACLHYAIHFLMQARFGVEAQEAWLYEGLAAYAAVRLNGVHGSWCVRLEDTSARKGKPEVPDDPEEWPLIVVSLVTLHDDFPLKGLIGASINGFDGGMLAKSWSIWKWMLEERPVEARDLLEARRAGASTEKALLGATGLSIEAFDDAWRRHVLEVGDE